MFEIDSTILESLTNSILRSIVSCLDCSVIGCLKILPCLDGVVLEKLKEVMTIVLSVYLVVIVVIPCC